MTEQNKPVKWEKSPSGVAEIYANMSHLTWSLDDIRIRIGQLIFVGNPGDVITPIAEERAAITVTWRNAKLLRDQLALIVDSYERANGEIKMDIKLASGTLP
jgi:hypothetical protein